LDRLGVCVTVASSVIEMFVPPMARASAGLGWADPVGRSSSGGSSTCSAGCGRPMAAVAGAVAAKEDARGRCHLANHGDAEVDVARDYHIPQVGLTVTKSLVAGRDQQPLSAHTPASLLSWPAAVTGRNSGGRTATTA
jgi:hypothetical protein